MSEFTELRFDQSTLECERDVFFGGSSEPQLASPELPSGTYRVVDGQLFRIVPGVPFRERPS